jgi:hypothetical protein
MAQYVFGWNGLRLKGIGSILFLKNGLEKRSKKMKNDGHKTIKGE